VDSDDQSNVDHRDDIDYDVESFLEINDAAIHFRNDANAYHNALQSDAFDDADETCINYLMINTERMCHRPEGDVLAVKNSTLLLRMYIMGRDGNRRLMMHIEGKIINQKVPKADYFS